MARPPSTSAEDVVRIACAIADADGLPAVSMRQVGRELGMTPMGLYRHIPDKARLLEAMVEHVAQEYDLDLPDEPREALLDLARQQRALIANHPWLPDLASRFHPMGAATLRYVECLLGLFENLDVPADSLLETVGLFNGFVTALANATMTAEPPVDEERGRELANLLTTGKYPRFAALAAGPHLDLDAHYDRLALRIIDGLARS